MQGVLLGILAVAFGGGEGLTLDEAIRLGLKNIENARLVDKECKDATQAKTVRVAPACPEIKLKDLRSEVAVQVQSVERQYWTLAECLARREVCEKAVSHYGEALQLAEAKGAEKADDTIAARRRLEQARIDLVKATSDVIDAERQLRQRLGLKAADQVRVISKTPLGSVRPGIEEYGWIAPTVGAAWFGAYQRTLLLVGIRTPFRLAVQFRGHDHCTQELSAKLEAAKHATQARQAASENLKAEHDAYASGRATIDRYLDAIARHACVAAEEAKCQSASQVSLGVLRKNHDFLLDCHGITIVDVAGRPLRDDGVKTASHRVKGEPETRPTGRHGQISFGFTQDASFRIGLVTYLDGDCEHPTP